MNSIYGLVSVWVNNNNGCGNSYKSKGFVRGLKKILVDDGFGGFDSFGRGLKKGIDVHVGEIFTCLGGD